jgi:hypothetical protein
MRSAQDWLTSSSSDSEEAVRAISPAPRPVSPAAGAVSGGVSGGASGGESDLEVARRRRADGAEARRLQQEELRAQMKAALGEKAVTAATVRAAPVPPIKQLPKGADATKMSALAKAKSVFDSFTSDDTNTNVGTARGDHQAGAVKPMTPEHLFGRGHGEEEGVHGVMVVNRGCQTATEVQCQTDPDPHAVSCPMCYEAWFGHPPPTAPSCAHGFANVQPGMNFQPLRPMGAAGTMAAAGMAYAPRPAAQPQVSATAYQLQIDNIQRQVDNIIHKYNLPGLPGMAL